MECGHYANLALIQQAEDIAQELLSEDIEALPYHAGMDPSVRARIQERFMKGDNIIVRTSSSMA